MDRDKLIALLMQLPPGTLIFTYNGGFLSPAEVVETRVSQSAPGEFYEDANGYPAVII